MNDISTLPYKPTEAEIDIIAELIGKHWGFDPDETVELENQLRDDDRIRVVRNFLSDGPGFMGDVFFVLFGGGPEYHLIVGHYKSYDLYKSSKRESWEVYSCGLSSMEGEDHG